MTFEKAIGAFLAIVVVCGLLCWVNHDETENVNNPVVPPPTAPQIGDGDNPVLPPPTNPQAGNQTEQEKREERHFRILTSIVHKVSKLSLHV